MNDLPQKFLLCCPPVAHGIVVVPAPGSIKEKCVACGTEVWLGPRQQAAKAERQKDAIVVCFLCAIQAQPNPDKLHSLGGKSHVYTAGDQN